MQTFAFMFWKKVFDLWFVPKYPRRDQTNLICRRNFPQKGMIRYLPYSELGQKSGHIRSWLDTAGYRDSRERFWLANCEFDYGKRLKVILGLRLWQFSEQTPEKRCVCGIGKVKRILYFELFRANLSNFILSTLYVGSLITRSHHELRTSEVWFNTSLNQFIISSLFWGSRVIFDPRLFRNPDTFVKCSTKIN